MADLERLVDKRILEAALAAPKGILLAKKSSNTRNVWFRSLFTHIPFSSAEQWIAFRVPTKALGASVVVEIDNVNFSSSVSIIRLLILFLFSCK